jgi:hypothetical protein
MCILYYKVCIFVHIGIAAEGSARRRNRDTRPSIYFVNAYCCEVHPATIVESEGLTLYRFRTLMFCAYIYIYNVQIAFRLGLYTYTFIYQHDIMTQSKSRVVRTKHIHCVIRYRIRRPLKETSSRSWITATVERYFYLYFRKNSKRVLRLHPFCRH